MEKNNKNINKAPKLNQSINKKYSMLKKHHTNTLLKAIEEKKVDDKLVSFLLKIKNIKNIFTSSSCAGRIMLLSTDENENKKISSFHKKYHRQVLFKEIKEDLEKDTNNDIWLKTEPFIFHFGCKDYDTAKEILSFCQEFGLKKAGIITAKEGKYILEVTSTQYMALPLKEKNKILVTDSYLDFIINRANKKLKLNYERLDLFSKTFINKFT